MTLFKTTHIIMKHFHYTSDILTNDESRKKIETIVNPRMYSLLTQDNNYPIIEHDEQHDLFVLIIPIYEPKKQSIRLVECNVLIGERDLYILTNSHEPILDNIISDIRKHREEYDSTIYSLILELSTHIITTIDNLERVIEQLKHITLENQ